MPGAGRATVLNQLAVGDRHAWSRARNPFSCFNCVCDCVSVADQWRYSVLLALTGCSLSLFPIGQRMCGCCDVPCCSVVVLCL